MSDLEKLIQAVNELTQVINKVIDKVVALEKEAKELQEIIKK